MKKFFALIVAVCFALSAMAETEFTFTSAADMNQTKDGYTISLAQGSNTQNAPVFQNPHYNSEYHPEMRMYLGNTITVSGENLTNIQMVFAKSGGSNKEYTGLSASVGDLVSGGTSTDATDWKVDSWTGNATSVVFTLTGKGQRQIQRIVIDGEPIVITPDEDVLPTEADLNPNYTYDEPTVVSVPDTTIIKKEYAFIDNNILVHCSLGSILKAEADSNPDDEEDDSHPAYFNCNANYEITFTATQPIKGIAIDGFVRKDFDASCDHGEIQYLTDEDKDMEGWPALVIMDINATSVTLSCPKQIRCYELRVYFQENPDPIDVVTTDTTDLYPVSAVAVDYSETEYSEEGSYSYWVKLSSANQYPEIWLDLYSAVKGDLSGSYSPYNYNVGEQNYVWFSDGETDAVTAYDIDVTIEKIEEGYSIAGVLTCWEQGKEWDDDSEDLIYRFAYEGPVRFVLPSEEGIENTQSETNSQKILRDGQLIILRGEKTYTASGIEIR